MANLENIENSEEIVKDTKQSKIKQLKDKDKIKVISLIPNVSYLDKRTGDEYEWEESEQIEVLEYSVIRDMWKNYKSYFKNYWLKPLDDRVIQELGLSKLYKDYDFVMDDANYTKENIESICEKYGNAPRQLKPSICNRIKTLVKEGKISNVKIIRTLENKLDVDLISLIED